MNILKPPSYCTDALPTKHGWVDPKTNELIVHVKNLLSRRQNELTSSHPVPETKKRGRPKKTSNVV